MNKSEPLLSFQKDEHAFLFNIYFYENRLIGIEEDPEYKQLFEMNEYGSIMDYFDWRRTQTGFGAMLTIDGKPLLKEHFDYQFYHDCLEAAEHLLSIPVREWGYRLRK